MPNEMTPKEKTKSQVLGPVTVGVLIEVGVVVYGFSIEKPWLVLTGLAFLILLLSVAVPRYVKALIEVSDAQR